MIDKSTSAALDRIFDEMYNLISAASRIPLTDKIIVEESDLAEILDDLKEAIPREVKSAAKLLEEQKAIINKAHEDADNIVVQAKTEAERIVEIAKAEAERLVRQEEVVQQAQCSRHSLLPKILKIRPCAMNRKLRKKLTLMQSA